MLLWIIKEQRDFAVITLRSLKLVVQVDNVVWKTHRIVAFICRLREILVTT